MQEFTGFQYLLVDLANHFGLDKLTFEERIQWAHSVLDNLEAKAEQAESPLLYSKCVQSIRKAQQGLPTGHIVAMDACCSGIQIMSALTGCISGATATGLVDPDRRADAYSELQERMQRILGGAFSVARKDAKAALMTSFYGSKLKPIEIFGENTPELTAFYTAGKEMAPGAFELLQDLLDSWQPFTLVHAWKLPDGYDARVRVMQKQEARIEVDELGGASFTYEYYVNEGSKHGLSNVANVIHSVDAFILREVTRRCGYDRSLVAYLDHWLEVELLERAVDPHRQAPATQGSHAPYLEYWQQSRVPTAAIFDHLDAANIMELPTDLLHVLKRMTVILREHKPFPVVTIHDSFGAHPNNVNRVRYWYKEVLAELAEGDLLSWILNQLHGGEGHYPKLSDELPQLIRNSNYALS